MPRPTTPSMNSPTVAPSVSGRGAWLERWWPHLLALLALGVVVAFPCLGAVARTIHDVFAAVINMAAIAIGFLATTKAILVSSSRSFTIRTLKATGKLHVLTGFMMTATWSLSVLAACTCALLFIDPDHLPRWFTWAFRGWCVLAVFAGAAAARVIGLFGVILHGLTTD